MFFVYFSKVWVLKLILLLLTVQLLKAVQNQISALSAKKYRTSSEQISLQRLFNEQQKILQCGKIVPTVSGQNSQGITYVRIFNSFK